MSNDEATFRIAENAQRALCERFGCVWTPSAIGLKVGVARNIIGARGPIYGVRHTPTRTTTGWYLWAGEYETRDDFYVPLHVEHMVSWCPILLPYLGLPPGWAFVIDVDGYEDVYKDPTLLAVDG